MAFRTGFTRQLSRDDIPFPAAPAQFGRLRANFFHSPTPPNAPPFSIEQGVHRKTDLIAAVEGILRMGVYVSVTLLFFIPHPSFPSHNSIHAADYKIQAHCRQWVPASPKWWILDRLGFVRQHPKKSLEFSIHVPPGWMPKMRAGKLVYTITNKRENGATTESNSISLESENRITVNWSVTNETTAPASGRRPARVINIPIVGTPRAPSFSQRYHALRRRFVENYWWSARVPDYIQPGKNATKPIVHFGDQTVQMANCLILFSTEIAIHRQLGSDCSDAIARIQLLLDGIDELDRKAEVLYGLPETSPNGFFVRDDIECNDPRLERNGEAVFSRVCSDWSHDKKLIASDKEWAGKELSSPSQDQYLWLFMGLLAVVELTDEPILIDHARQVEQRMFNYCANSKFYIRLPINGHPRMNREGNMRPLYPLICHVHHRISNSDCNFVDKQLLSPNELGIVNLLSGGRGLSHFWDEGLDGVKGLPYGSLAVTNSDQAKPFVWNFVLMLVGAADVWPNVDFELKCVNLTANPSRRHEMAILWSSVLQRRMPITVSHKQLMSILDSVPEDGPSSKADPKTGWHHENRWSHCNNLDSEPSKRHEQYSGLDWLIFHNLLNLAYSERCVTDH